MNFFFHLQKYELLVILSAFPVDELAAKQKSEKQSYSQFNFFYN